MAQKKPKKKSASGAKKKSSTPAKKPAAASAGKKTTRATTAARIAQPAAAEVPAPAPAEPIEAAPAETLTATESGLPTAIEAPSPAIDLPPSADERSESAIDRSESAIDRSESAIDRSGSAIDGSASAIDRSESAIHSETPPVALEVKAPVAEPASIEAPAAEAAPIELPVEVPAGPAAATTPEPVAAPAGLVDAFGRDPAFEQKALALLEPVYRRYFRVRVQGAENVPANGPVLLVANHSGALPWDSVMLKCALQFDHPAQRDVRPLTENELFHFPFLGTTLNRLGAVRACPENAEALLAEGAAVAVFPEGMKGLGKPFRKRYHLQRFGRGGFVKLALRMNVPIVPVAIVGAEEANPLVTRLDKAARALGLPYLPVTPTFPLLGPLGLLPLPTRWTIDFGRPIHLDPDGPTDELTIARHTEDVRSLLQARLNELLARRVSVFF